MEEKLYKIGELSEKEWLTTEYSGSATLVFYNADIVLPTLSELKCDTVFICEQDVNTYSVATVGGEESEAATASRPVSTKNTFTAERTTPTLPLPPLQTTRSTIRSRVRTAAPTFAKWTATIIWRPAFPLLFLKAKTTKR